MDTGAELRGLPGGPGGVGHVGRCGGQRKHTAPPTSPTQPPGEQGSWHGAPSTCLALGELWPGGAASRLGLALSVSFLLVLFWAGVARPGRGWKRPTQSTVEPP